MSEDLGTTAENVAAGTPTDDAPVTEERTYTQSELDKLRTQAQDTRERNIREEYAAKEAQATADREAEAKAKRQARLEKEEKFKELYPPSEDSNAELMTRLDKMERDGAVDKLIAEKEIPIERQGLYRAANCPIDELSTMMDQSEAAFAVKVQDQEETEMLHDSPKGTTNDSLEDFTDDPLIMQANLRKKAFASGKKEDAEAALNAKLMNTIAAGRKN